MISVLNAVEHLLLVLMVICVSNVQFLIASFVNKILAVLPVILDSSSTLMKQLVLVALFQIV